MNKRMIRGFSREGADDQHYDDNNSSGQQNP